MNEHLEEFEDWSHPSRPLTLPRRRPPLHWGRILAAVLGCGLIWGVGHVIRMIHDAYATVFAP